MARWMTASSSGSRCWSAQAMLDTSAPARIRTARRNRSGSKARAHERERVLQRKFLAIRIAPIAIFKFPGLQATLSNDHAVRNTKKLGVRELHSRPGVTVVIEDLDSGGRKLSI